MDHGQAVPSRSSLSLTSRPSSGWLDLLVKAHMLHDRLRESVGDDDEARQRAVKYIAAALEQPDAGP
jgi:hypothetical protein